MVSPLVIGGFDPGGNQGGGSGVALICLNPSVAPTIKTYTAFSVLDAISWINSNNFGNIDGFGIDTLLSWSVFQSGWRPMDWYIKHHYSSIKNSVVSPNSLMGSMAIQGMVMAISLKNQYENILLNETHPKAQYYALIGTLYDYNSNKANMDTWLLSTIGGTVLINNEHEWDALFSAWATYMGITGNWGFNLVQPYNNLIMPAGKTYYFWR
jgi:hypothetical protein